MINFNCWSENIFGNVVYVLSNELDQLIFCKYTKVRAFIYVLSNNSVSIILISEQIKHKSEFGLHTLLLTYTVECYHLYKVCVYII